MSKLINISETFWGQLQKSVELLKNYASDNLFLGA